MRNGLFFRQSIKCQQKPVGGTRLTRLTSGKGLPAVFAKYRTGSQMYNVPIFRSKESPLNAETVFELTPVLFWLTSEKGSTPDEHLCSFLRWVPRHSNRRGRMAGQRQSAAAGRRFRR